MRDTADTLTVRQAAALLDVNADSVRRLVKAGTIPSTRFGAAISLRKADVESLNERGWYGRGRGPRRARADGGPPTPETG